MKRIEPFKDRLTRAKAILALDYPFVGTIALNFTYDITDKVPTAAVDGKMKTIYFNPKYFENLDDDNLLFAVAHECFHPMLEHHVRCDKRDKRLWNIAGDFVINKYLVDEEIGEISKQWLHNEELFAKGNGTTEGIYDILKEESDKNKRKGKGKGKGGGGSKWYGDGKGDAQDECVISEGSVAEKEEQGAEWRQLTAQAAQAAKMMGKLSANTKRFVDALTTVKVRWEDIMHRFVERYRAEDRSWSRFNRRMLGQGIYLPGSSGVAIPSLTFAVDCSGSIGEAELTQFMTEINYVKEVFEPLELHMVYFDAEVTNYEKFVRGECVELNPKGGGGTAFSPVFEYMTKNDISPTACIFLTDLCCNDFGEAPEYPVLWVTTDPGKAPFGEIVEFNR